MTTQHADRRAPPTLLANRGAGGSGPQSLADLMHEGFYALYLMQNGSGPQNAGVFAEHMTRFLADVERRARHLGMHADDVGAASYAFCAAVDETILRSDYPMREAWQVRPLQLRLFGDNQASEHFFHKLDALRARGVAHMQALEIFHLCLLMGFRGRQAPDGDDKLTDICATLGHEIARMRGKARAFAPHAARPDRIANKLRSGLSLWVLTAVFALAGLAVFAGLRASLDHASSQLVTSPLR
ncbi:type IVB secretion system protein IcmH/DotU [Massilia sp. R2A-15]|uniref:type IVB secretion system protein IcmH/DotU n=1 Tax=Massilia sp. R2A-15 TaxID=3064278 RepID=UPI0027330B68|nr:type IVB secretion system protein IcmH/DotU [Massilia sp. R2A-15]WLI90692.1 type IVB secretion system protein IcmH/DotU [Massilia sp. R2A-15]